jgi:hypothetical protein
MSTAADYSVYYGAVTLSNGLSGAEEDFVTVEDEIVPDTWMERNPVRRFLQLNSKPLTVPHEVDSWYVAEVL